MSNIAEKDHLLRKYVDNTLRAGMKRLIVLHSIKKHRTYPYALLKVLKKSDHIVIRKITKSEIYNILNSLEKKGLVKGELKRVGQKMQKMYHITPSGNAVLLETKGIIVKYLHELKILIADEFNE